MDFSAFLPHVLQYTPGCPESLAIDHIRKAARMFCARTQCWNFEDRLLTGNGQDVYPLPVDDDIERVKLTALRVDGTTYTTVDATRGRSWGRDQNSSRFGFLSAPSEITVNPVPRSDDREIFMQLSVKPSLTSTEWPDELAEYIDDIAHGAVSSLAGIPKEAWTDRQVASDHYAMFMQRCSAVSINVARGYQSRRKCMQRFI